MMNSMFFEKSPWMNVYIVDLCCYTSTFDEHLMRINTLRTLQKSELTIKFKKCKFALTKITFLDTLFMVTVSLLIQEKMKRLLNILIHIPKNNSKVALPV